LEYTMHDPLMSDIRQIASPLPPNCAEQSAHFDTNDPFLRAAPGERGTPVPWMLNAGWPFVALVVGLADGYARARELLVQAECYCWGTGYESCDCRGCDNVRCFNLSLGRGMEHFAPAKPVPMEVNRQLPNPWRMLEAQ
jgi:hypothetical protein